MRLNEYLADRLKEVFTEGKWVLGTNFKEQIIDLDWKQATQKIDDFNTIADLTFHIDYYIAGVANVLKGGTLDIRDKYSFDYPDRKSTRLNSSHVAISYAVFCSKHTTQHQRRSNTQHPRARSVKSLNRN